MPSIKIITPILGGNYYHIFNRGINRQNIFFNPKNYIYFLQLLDHFLSESISVLAYCLLPNHFHLVIKVNDEISDKTGIPSLRRDGIPITSDEEIGKIVSNQFRRMFISYTMAINKQESRTGSLFDKNFKRLNITEHEYLQYAIFYVHYNPEKHGLADYKKYKYNSYLSYLSNRSTKTDRILGFDIFDGKESFLNYHSVMHEEREAIILE